MKFPKVTKTYCPKCKTHTTHNVQIYKKGKERKLSAGARHHEREKHGYGGQKYPEFKKNAKLTKKVMLKLACEKCKYIIQKKGIRLKKSEIKA